MFLLIRLWTESGFKPQVSSSISAKTGLAPTNNALFAVEINVNDGTITSSSFPMPWAKSDACSADVPELNVIACLVPI